MGRGSTRRAFWNGLRSWDLVGMARGTIEHDRMCTLVLLQRPGELLAAMEQLHGDRHNGFHLIYADLRDAFATWSDGFSVHHESLQGLRVITERSFGAGEGERERTVAAAFEGLPIDLQAWREPM